MNQPRWIAYLDGELPPAEREALDQLLAAPTAAGEAARAQLAAIRASWSLLERADASASEALATHRNAAPLWPQVQARLAPVPDALGAGRPAWVPRMALAGTLAGGLAMGAGLGLWFLGDGSADSLDLTAYTSLSGLPEGSLADLYLAQVDGDDASNDGAVDAADHDNSATNSAAANDTAGGAR